ncbi:MAG: IPT/TIG domain-containing protein [Rikenellaceae bacterium]
MKFLKYIFAGVLSVALFACEDATPYGEDYDIELPVSSITNFSPEEAFVDDVITVEGENLDMVTSLSIGGTASCTILSQEANVLTFQVSRSASRGQVYVTNKYSRDFISEEYLTVNYYPTMVTAWPTELQNGTSFTLKGENIDLISKVTVDGQTVSRQGTAESSKATYTLMEITLDSEYAVIVVEDLTGQIITSSEIPVTAASDTYVPSNTIWLADFDTVDATFEDGWSAGDFTSSVNGSTIAPMFQNYWSIVAPAGNGWNGCYTKMTFNNGGSGYDISGFSNPYITFAVNTNGKSGYFSVSIDGTENHLTGQSGEYSDSYRITTDGWEWRSYNLADLGFSVSGSIGYIQFWVRGGNISDSEAFEINLDQVMLTDGPLKPLVALDMEGDVNAVNGSGVWSQNGGTGFSTVAQGETYYTLKAQIASAWADVIGTIYASSDIACEGYDNALYYNFLVNTGTTAAGGYFQMSFSQDGYDYVKHFYGNESYEDSYSFSTAGEWQWRSWKVDDLTYDWTTSGAPGLNFSSPFTLKVESKSGNIGVDKGNSGEFELNIDYVIFTATPIDNK